MTMRIVLLGGSGFLGQAVLRQLHAWDGEREAHCLEHRSPVPGYDFVRRQQGTLASMPASLLPSGPHVVVHCASKQVDSDGRGFGENRRAVDRLLSLVGSDTRAIVYASSFSVYGDGPQAAVTEAAPLNPRTALAKSRAECEQRLLSGATAAGCEVAVLRARFVVGQGDRHFLPGLAKLIRARVRIGDGTQRYSVIDVDDYARVILSLCSRYLDAGYSASGEPQIFNVGYRTPVAFNEIANVLCQQGGWPPPRYPVPLSNPLIRGLGCLPIASARQLAERLQLLGYDHYGVVDRLAAVTGSSLLDRDPRDAVRASASLLLSPDSDFKHSRSF